MQSPTTLQIIGAFLFALALVHTFSTHAFERLARLQPRHAGLWHLLGEVEIVFGLWALILIVVMLMLQGKPEAVTYLESRDFTEPMFVFVIMVIAGTRPILQLSSAVVLSLSRFLPFSRGPALYFLVLALVPLLGSLITEPAAMTVAALMLRQTLFNRDVTDPLKYATLGVLFVNVSIGGTLTPFAAPPVLMVAAEWNWDLAFMLLTFGWKSALAVCINAAIATALFGKQLQHLADDTDTPQPLSMPVAFVHVAFLTTVVVFAHHAEIFIGLFLFFMGFATAYKHHQDRLILREALLVAFFLSGLIVLGGLQQWWLEPLLMGLDDDAVFWGAVALTAVTDNAALTYLGSLVQGLSDEFKVALVAGAVTGGGLTVIANAPNPAGVAILRGHFRDSTVRPLSLLVAAVPPTLVAAMAFRLP